MLSLDPQEKDNPPSPLHNITPSQDYHYWNIWTPQLNEPTNQTLIKVSKVVKPMNKKILLCNLGTRLMSNPMSPTHPWIKLFYSAVCLILSLQRSLSSEIAACCKKLIPQR